MDLTPSEDQQALAAMVGQLLGRKADSRAVRAAATTELGFDESLWRTLCEQVGVAALTVPEEYEGFGAGLVESALVLERLGHALAPSPLVSSLLVSEALLAAGGSEACARLLPGIAAGARCCLAWAGAHGTAEVSEPLLLDRSGTTVSGRIPAVLDAHGYDVLLVFAHADDGPVLAEVAADGPACTPVPGLDTTLRYADLDLDAVPATILASGTAAERTRRHAHAVGSVAVSALAVGCAQRGLDMTVAYAGEREQFGRPIGSFQALKHRMADMLVAVETARSAVWAAACSVAARDRSGAPDQDGDLLVAAAKSWSSEAVALVAAETVQLHGGIAITMEHDAQMVLKRAHALGMLFGQPHRHRAAIAPAVLGGETPA